MKLNQVYVAAVVLCVAVAGVAGAEDANLAAAKKYLAVAGQHAANVTGKAEKAEAYAVLLGYAKHLDDKKIVAAGAAALAQAAQPGAFEEATTADYIQGMVAESYAAVGDSKMMRSHLAAIKTPGVLAESKAYCAARLARNGYPDQAAKLVQECIHAAKADKEMMADYDLSYPLGQAVAVLNDDVAATHFAELLEDPIAKVIFFANVGTTHGKANRTRKAKAFLVKAEAIVDDMEDGEDKQFAKQNFANGMLFIGMEEEALAIIKQMHKSEEDRPVLTWLMADVIRAAAREGDAKASRHAAGQLTDVLTKPPTHDDMLLEVWVWMEMLDAKVACGHADLDQTIAKGPFAGAKAYAAAGAMQAFYHKHRQGRIKAAE